MNRYCVHAVRCVSNLLLKTVIKETKSSTMEVQFAWEMCRTRSYLRIPYVGACFSELRCCPFASAGNDHPSADDSEAGAGGECGDILSPTHPSLLPPLHP